jgi:Protein of unknown function (DUF3313)
MTPYSRWRRAMRKTAEFAIIALLATAGLSACSTTKEARSVTPSGFLGDYSNLHPSVANEPLLVYGNPTADCRQYTQVMFDPVTLWARSDDSSLQQLSETDRDKLRALGARALRVTFTEAGFSTVATPGTHVMRVRAAFTEAEKANVLLEDVSAVAPYVSGAATLYAEGKGQALFTGDVAYEMEFVDSLSGERLAASVDKRVGLMDIRNTDPWDSINAAIKVWQERGLKRLQACQRTGSFLSRPREQNWDQKVESYRP